MQRETKQIRLGFLYPGYAAEDDYPLLAMNAGQEIIVHVVHTSQDEDAHRVDALLDLGSLSRLLEGAKILRDQVVDAVVWACTSGSFVFGWEGARQQVEAIAQATGVPASSTPFAFVDATRALGISWPTTRGATLVWACSCDQAGSKQHNDPCLWLVNRGHYEPNTRNSFS